MADCVHLQGGTVIEILYHQIAKVSRWDCQGMHRCVCQGLNPRLCGERRRLAACIAASARCTRLGSAARIARPFAKPSGTRAGRMPLPPPGELVVVADWQAGVGMRRRIPPKHEKSTSVNRVLFFNGFDALRAGSPGQTARWTLPAFKHRVHTRRRLTVPFTFTRTGCRFGSQRRRVLFSAWLTRLPVCGCFPHTSQRFAISPHPLLCPPPFPMVVVGWRRLTRLVYHAPAQLRNSWGWHRFPARRNPA